jgi:hypothetical protein
MCEAPDLLMLVRVMAVFLGGILLSLVIVLVRLLTPLGAAAALADVLGMPVEVGLDLASPARSP